MHRHDPHPGRQGAGGDRIAGVGGKAEAERTGAGHVPAAVALTLQGRVAGLLQRLAHPGMARPCCDQRQVQAAEGVLHQQQVHLRRDQIREAALAAGLGLHGHAAMKPQQRQLQQIGPALRGVDAQAGLPHQGGQIRPRLDGIAPAIHPGHAAAGMERPPALRQGLLGRAGVAPAPQQPEPPGHAAAGRCGHQWRRRSEPAGAAQLQQQGEGQRCGMGFPREAGGERRQPLGRSAGLQLGQQLDRRTVGTQLQPPLAIRFSPDGSALLRILARLLQAPDPLPGRPGRRDVGLHQGQPLLQRQGAGGVDHPGQGAAGGEAVAALGQFGRHRRRRATGNIGQGRIGLGRSQAAEGLEPHTPQMIDAVGVGLRGLAELAQQRGAELHLARQIAPMPRHIQQQPGELPVVWPALQLLLQPAEGGIDQPPLLAPLHQQAALLRIQVAAPQQGVEIGGEAGGAQRHGRRRSAAHNPTGATAGGVQEWDAAAAAALRG